MSSSNANPPTPGEATIREDIVICAHDETGPVPPSKLPLQAFDDLLHVVKDSACYTSGLKAHAPNSAEVPCAFGKHEGWGIVLRNNCAVELGGGAEGSCAMVFTTADESLVEDGRITVYGPDMPQMDVGSTMPFAQIALVAGSKLVGSCHQALEECQSVRDWVRNCQLRSAPGEVYLRIGREAFDAGLTLPSYGRALIELFKQANDRVRAVEVLFVTSSPQEVKALYPLRDKWKQVSHDLRRDTWADLGVDIDCPSGGHCGNCKDEATCNRVRRIQSLRRTELELRGTQ